MARFYATAESISKKFNIIVPHVVPKLFRITSHAITMNNSSSPKEGFRFLSRCHIEDGLHSAGFFHPSYRKWSSHFGHRAKFLGPKHGKTITKWFFDCRVEKSWKSRDSPPENNKMEAFGAFRYANARFFSAVILRRLINSDVKYEGFFKYIIMPFRF